MAIFSTTNGAIRLILRLEILFCLSYIAAASFHALSQSERAAVERLFGSADDGITSLEDKYRALRSLQVLGIKRDERTTCERVTEILAASSYALNETFYATKIADILSCPLPNDDLKAVAGNMLSVLRDNPTLLDLHYSIGTLALIKAQNGIEEDLALESAIDIFKTVKALGQVDGTWKYSLNEGETSARAAGIALETLAGLIRIAGSAIEESMIVHISSATSKLFDSIESYDDGAQYFDEKSVDALISTGGPLSVTSTVVRGVTTFAEAVPGRLKISAEKMVGLANFFLTIGLPANCDDAFYQLDALGSLEANSLVVPLVLFVPNSVISLTSRDMLEVSVTTVLGTPIPATVTLVKANKAESKKALVSSNKVLERDANGVTHRLDLLATNFDLGKYDLKFQVKPFDEGRYSAGAFSNIQIIVTGNAKVLNVEIGIFDSDTGSPDTLKKWNPSTKEAFSLFATHRQKLHLSLDVVSPLDEPFLPHQVFVKLRHESNVEHLFLVIPNGKHLELNLDFLGLVEQLNYLSGVYTMELIVGDSSMENSFLWVLGTIELDLPEASEGVAKPFTVADIQSLYGPKPEITHVFRPAEKRPPPPLSNAFLVLTLLPLLGFLAGPKLLSTNMRSFPTSGLPMLAALAFHGGIASILGLYILFWTKLNLFETLRFLGVLAIFLVIPGHYLLSYLADTSSKVKSA